MVRRDPNGLEPAALGVDTSPTPPSRIFCTRFLAARTAYVTGSYFDLLALGGCSLRFGKRSVACRIYPVAVAHASRFGQNVCQNSLDAEGVSRLVSAGAAGRRHAGALGRTNENRMAADLASYFQFHFFQVTNRLSG